MLRELFIVGLVVLLGFGIYSLIKDDSVSGMTSGADESLQINQGDVNVVVESSDEGPISPVSEDDNNDIDYCAAYTNNYPTYFMVKEAQCGAAGGDYICTENKAGCFDITSWNSTMCSSAQAQALKAYCTVLQGDWTCTATDVGCEKN